MISEVDPEKAEAILTIRMFIPGVIEDGKDQYHLARTPPRQCNSVIESVTVNPDGSITTRGTISSDARADLIKCSYARGRTADGRAFGFRKSVSLDGDSADTVIVKISMNWTARDGERGRFNEELVVPWLGATRKELSGRGWVVGEITPVGEMDCQAVKDGLKM
jgi:hypothetical protein